jgi:hypothetical protein
MTACAERHPDGMTACAERHPAGPADGAEGEGRKSMSKEGTA